jgi:predicted metal-dependent hydrolase
MVSKYGVCQHSPINKITLGLQTVSYAKEIIEYLIVHELVHVLHPHHQKSF